MKKRSRRQSKAQKRLSDVFAPPDPCLGNDKFFAHLDEICAKYSTENEEDCQVLDFSLPLGEDENGELVNITDGSGINSKDQILENIIEDWLHPQPKRRRIIDSPPPLDEMPDDDLDEPAPKPNKRKENWIDLNKLNIRVPIVTHRSLDALVTPKRILSSSASSKPSTSKSRQIDARWNRLNTLATPMRIPSRGFDVVPSPSRFLLVPVDTLSLSTERDAVEFPKDVLKSAFVFDNVGGEEAPQPPPSVQRIPAFQVDSLTSSSMHVNEETSEDEEDNVILFSKPEKLTPRQTPALQVGNPVRKKQKGVSDQVALSGAKRQHWLETEKRKLNAEKEEAAGIQLIPGKTNLEQTTPASKAQPFSQRHVVMSGVKARHWRKAAEKRAKGKDQSLHKDDVLNSEILNQTSDHPNDSHLSVHETMAKNKRQLMPKERKPGNKDKKKKDGASSVSKGFETETKKLCLRNRTIDIKCPMIRRSKDRQAVKPSGRGRGRPRKERPLIKAKTMWPPVSKLQTPAFNTFMSMEDVMEDSILKSHVPSGNDNASHAPLYGSLRVLEDDFDDEDDMILCITPCRVIASN